MNDWKFFVILITASIFKKEADSLGWPAFSEEHFWVISINQRSISPLNIKMTFWKCGKFKSQFRIHSDNFWRFQISSMHCGFQFQCRIYSDSSTENIQTVKLSTNSPPNCLLQMYSQWKFRSLDKIFCSFNNVWCFSPFFLSKIRQLPRRIEVILVSVLNVSLLLSIFSKFCFVLYWNKHNSE